tara:strand:- start:845 stop:1153 length:309 start_codon:yes stop_codon:yes gene_type:complete
LISFRFLLSYSKLLILSIYQTENQCQPLILQIFTGDNKNENWYQLKFEFGLIASPSGRGSFGIRLIPVLFFEGRNTNDKAYQFLREVGKKKIKIGFVHPAGS